jgi:hypothetical protein
MPTVVMGAAGRRRVGSALLFGDFPLENGGAPFDVASQDETLELALGRWGGQASDDRAGR